MPALLPEDYLPDVNMRLSFYKRIASARSDTELTELKIELIDRFGLLPDAGRHLLAAAGLRLQAQDLGIRRIEAQEKGGFVEFSEKTMSTRRILSGFCKITRNSTGWTARQN